MTDRITLTGLRARGFHGVLPAERELGQEFVVDLVLHVDTRAAAAGDDLTATVNYADVAREAVEVITGPPVDLIETVAAAIAERALGFAGVQAVDVAVHKPSAPIPHPFTDVTVHIHRSAPAPLGTPAPRAPAPAPAATATPAPAATTPAERLGVSSGSPADPASTLSVEAGGGSSGTTPGGRLGVSSGSPADPGSTLSGEAGAGARGAGGAGRSREVVLALGANEGDARAALRSALTQLGRHTRVRVAAVSPLLRSRAHVLPGAPPQPDYLNAVAVLETTLPPRELLALCQGIELGHGRVRQETWGPRPLDLDLVAAGDTVWDAGDLTLPHPRAHERAFVLAPWARIAPEAELPGHGRVADLAARVGEDGLEWLADRWWEATD